MDKPVIKSFAVNARNKLIQGVTQKAYQIGISEKEIKHVNEIQDGVSIEINNNYIYLTHSENEQREKLLAQIESKGYEQVMEEVAYTWFNRIIAIRFMEVNEYLPTGIRVLSSEDESKIEPDAVKQVNSIVEDLGLNLDAVYKFQDDNNDDGLFKYILIKQCNSLGKIMPVMFEKIQDYIELLLPDNLLVEGNVVSDLVKNISEEDFKEQVEIIGWLYQYYIAEKKDAVFADLKKNIKITKENIPAATQLFTPDWIVKYMVENSLGRFWLEGHPNEELQSNWKYYLEEAEQDAEVQAELNRIREESKTLSPEDITVLDPCMGSGHILVYAFDVLYKIYVSAGYSEREIPRLILENNLYGLDIDDRAGQLAYFALIMKARSYSRRLFRKVDDDNPIKVNVCSIQESNGIMKGDIEYFANGDEELKKDIEYLVEVFTDAKEYGSILEVRRVDFERIENRLVEINEDIVDLFTKESSQRILDKLPKLVKQGKIMSNKYDVMCTNPPYMGRSSMGPSLKKYLDTNFKISKSDLFAVFMELDNRYTKRNRFITMINQHSWMFLSSFKDLREVVLKRRTIYSMLHLGARAFEEIGGEVVQSTVFILLNNKVKNYKSKFIRLVNYTNSNSKKNHFKSNDNLYLTNSDRFINIPGYPIAYWVCKNIWKNYSKYDKLKYYAEYSGAQNKTANNEKYIRSHWEVEKLKVNNRWIKIAKGGQFRKWAGNIEEVIDWGEDAKQFYKSNKTSCLMLDKFLFREGITWTKVTSYAKAGFRYIDNSILYETAAPTIHIDNNCKYFLGLLNSIVGETFIKVTKQTLNYQVFDIVNIPASLSQQYIKKIEDLVINCILVSTNDWNLFETSWDFKKHPIIELKSNNIENSFNNLAEFTEKQFNTLKACEEELNRIFIDIYRLQEELTPEVEDKDITIRKADRERDIKSFISYAVGCMLGRYSLDEEGLVFAGGEFDMNEYKTFKADTDGIIPINDNQYFEDDIVTKFVEFVKVIFGEDTLEQNLNYIADTECFKRKASESSRDCLRRYFLKGFMEDHLKVYQKRPIYWMFDSGKQNGFKALIYMHRYDEKTVAKIRTDYLHSLQRTYEAEVSRLEKDITSEALSTKEKANAKKRKDIIYKQLVECVAYDQVIAHVANQRVSIDLDDGVKINYQKFQGVEIPMDDGRKNLKADLLFKVKM